MTKKKTTKKIVKALEMSPEEQARYEVMATHRKLTFRFEKDEEGKLDYSFDNKMSVEHETLLVCEALGVRTFTSAHYIATRLGNFAGRNGMNVDKINHAISMVADLEPRDNIEAMLVSQMFTVHELMMECSTRAHTTGQTFEGTQLNLNSAIKLSRSYVALVDSLNKHRGKGQQKMTVEHVHVNDGGQAIIGNVDQASKSNNKGA